MVYDNKLVASLKVGGKILREHDKDHVYLPFGSQYSILIKNMRSRKASIRIRIDGEDVLDHHTLILRGKETMELQRFIVNGNFNTGPAFKFIEKTQQISEHRGDKIDDGIIEVDYRFEAESPIFKFHPIKEIHHYHHPPEKFDSDWTYTNNDSTAINPLRSRSMKGDNTVYSSSVSPQSISSPNQLNHLGPERSNVVSDSLDPIPSDEGITVKGEEVNQHFTYGHIGRLETITHTICLKLHGTNETGTTVQKPLLVQSKPTCQVCGTKNDSRSKYCSHCGNNLTW